RSTEQWVGRTSQNKTVVFNRMPGRKVGDTVAVTITDATSATLLGL
ncbi:MAG: TRAM domain-containing protein, partial [Muribaculaceae bacterium]|nr:TRAM domain-containing protein [Muribaculaceae bacterium]